MAESRDKSLLIQGQMKSIIESGIPHIEWEDRLKQALRLYLKAMAWTPKDLEDESSKTT